MKKTAIGILVVSLFAGCVQQGGVVTRSASTPGWEKGPAVGLKAPRVEFLGADGKEHALTLGNGWIGIVGFVESRGTECCMLSPVLTEAASRYWDKPVRVVQVSLPTTKCPHGAGCVESCHVKPLHLIALCDSDRTAYNAFGKPKDQTVLVTDGSGKVVQVTTLSKIEKIYQHVDKLAEEAAKQQLPSYLEIY